MKKLDERRVNPDLLRLDTSQKRVLMKTVEADDPKRAAEDVASSSDSRNLMSAVKILAKYGLVTTFPPILGPDDEPAAIELTDEGQEHADDYNVTEDPSLRLPEEVAASEPEGQPAETGTGGAEMGMGAEPAAGEVEMGLELSSFFQEIHNWSRVLKD